VWGPRSLDCSNRLSQSGDVPGIPSDWHEIAAGTVASKTKMSALGGSLIRPRFLARPSCRKPDRHKSKAVGLIAELSLFVTHATEGQARPRLGERSMKLMYAADARALLFATNPANGSLPIVGKNERVRISIRSEILRRTGKC
jgi:hypothetical protein